MFPRMKPDKEEASFQPYAPKEKSTGDGSVITTHHKKRRAHKQSLGLWRR